MFSWRDMGAWGEIIGGVVMYWRLSWGSKAGRAAEACRCGLLWL